MVTFQLVSDLHLELRGGLRAKRDAYPTPRTELLVLAGDIYPIGAPDFPEVMRRISEGFRLTLYVPGNHEFYGMSGNLIDIEHLIATRTNVLNNVFCLNNTSITVNDATFIGATMWTNPPRDQWEYGAEAMNDYHAIKDRAGVPITVEDTVMAHKRQVAWIARALAAAKKAKRTSGAVIVTHHAPQMALDSRTAASWSRDSSLIPYYYASDVNGLCRDKFVKIWAYGHTHKYQFYSPSTESVTFASNPLGYAHENTEYIDELVIHM